MYKKCPHWNNGLIEAYWNVNIEGLTVEGGVPLRFNRSILKCKSFKNAAVDMSSDAV